VAVLGTALEHKDAAILNDDFGFDLLKTRGADGERDVVKEIRASAGHDVLKGA
jgi:hypothetical protein